MPTSHRDSAAADAVSLEPLKAWIAQQEDYARLHDRPAPLTDEQRAARLVLVPAPVPSPSSGRAGVNADRAASDTSSSDDDNLLHTDWISLLLRYTQASKPLRALPKFDEEQVARRYSVSPLWRFRCQIADAPDRWFPDLPREDCGGAPSDVGLYTKKKDARQYAARSACKWLMQNGYMPSDGRSVTFPRSSPQQAPLSVKRPFSATVSPRGVATPEPPRPEPKASHSVQPSRPEPKASSSTPASTATTPPPSTPPTSAGTTPPSTGTTPPTSAGTTPPASTATTPPASGGMVRKLPAVRRSPARAQIQSMASWQPPTPSSTNSTSSTDLPTAAASNSTTKPTPKPKKVLKAGDLEDVPNTHRLEALCRQRKLGTPVYTVWPGGTEGVEGIFSGRIVLVAGGGGIKETTTTTTLPPGVGEVQDVYTKKAAREKAAQSVLDYLQGEGSE